VAGQEAASLGTLRGAGGQDLLQQAHLCSSCRPSSSISRRFHRHPRVQLQQLDGLVDVGHREIGMEEMHSSLALVITTLSFAGGVGQRRPHATLPVTWASLLP
jgi:hypothetical protein